MTKRFSLFLIVFCCLFSACFEAVEEINYLTDKSGKYSLIINCSQSRDRINTLLKADSFLGHKIPSLYEINKQCENAYVVLKSCPGIHHVYYQIDPKQYIAHFTFEFDSTQALNLALHKAIQSSNPRLHIPQTAYFTKTKTVFERHNPAIDSTLLNISKNNSLLQVFKAAKISTIYRFTETVSSSSNTGSKIAQNKKAVMVQYPFTELYKNPNLAHTKIQLQ